MALLQTRGRRKISNGSKRVVRWVRKGGFEVSIGEGHGGGESETGIDGDDISTPPGDVIIRLDALDASHLAQHQPLRWVGISLWLVPPAEERDKLRSVISTISSKHSSPTFEPHITLVTLPSDANAAIPNFDNLSSFEITFQPVAAGQTFFQSVLIPIPASPELLDLRVSACDALKVPFQPYFPHLSLYYGDVSDEERETIIKELHADGTAQIGTDGNASVAGIQGFRVHELWVVKCEGKPEEWEVLEKREMH
ncbi:hypothetical protein BOTBODRAFT_189691 [Botryobasidium botryosum FD-172 SS1]|uniref:2',3'-cyclic-nucleotide 3'-phosphodiesterase n=1 Tax=Botryobasidium botryosum (strain FD-172 SS1) TaxID=930990 RepID=A0A067M7F6_BOTB1|nr:hypothetical protein BOTBODRAFT_189691 [Botryobasidium botryosum FD-172 SS1]